ncbi:IS66 family transposase [Candidatus Tisiphia endosymbiont of Oplodontha viridula]|uniref:IS66 family transposase n=1 Tax=Candidatus Tisiphia endosymbiont of Oplodontha viridula TaxID=3077925 RepID=UPI0035C8BF54
MSINLESQEVDLEQVINLLQVRNQEFMVENEELRCKIIALEDKLNINSTNSGLPTSREIFQAEKKTRPKSDRKPGGQPNHSYNSYKMKRADVIVDVMPHENICKCGGILTLTEEYKLHQKIEIPVIQPVVTEYQLRQKICTICNKKYTGRLNNYKLLGKNTESIIGSLGGFFNNSKRDIQQILSQIFNLDISLGLVSTSEGRISEKLENKYNELVNLAQTSSYLHLDETSSNNKGKRHWCWVAANSMVTVFKLASSRGKKVLEGFLPKYEGKVISDRYAVYNIYNNQNRQVCLAHLRRDFKRFAHSKHKNLATVGRDLLEIIDTVFRFYNLYKVGKVDKFRYLWIMRKIKERMLYYLEGVLNINSCKQA